MSLSTNNSLIKELRKILADNNIAVSDIEMTSGNYDDNKTLIKNDIPTITTDLCEIGLYDNICYFTVIAESSFVTDNLLSEIIKYPGLYIYGFKKFQENYYPTDNFSISLLKKQVALEKYVQIQFNFDINKLKPEEIYIKYNEVKSIFESRHIKVINQLTDSTGLSL